MAAIESFVLCKLCNTEQVIPVVAGKLRMHFYCQSCHQLVHVKKEEIRQSTPPPPPEPAPEPEPEPAVPEPPIADTAPRTATDGTSTPTIFEGDPPKPDSPSLWRGGGSLPSDEAWNEVSSPSSWQRFARSPLREQSLEDSHLRSSMGRWSPGSSFSRGEDRGGSSLERESVDDNPGAYYGRAPPSPRGIASSALPQPTSPTFSSLHRNSSDNRHLSSQDSRGRDPQISDSPRHTPSSPRRSSFSHFESRSFRGGSSSNPPHPPLDPEPPSPSSRRSSAESVEPWTSQAVDLHRPETISRIASSPRSPSRPLLWRSSFNTTTPLLDRNPSTINPSATDPPPPSVTRRSWSTLPYPSTRRASNSSFNSFSSEEDVNLSSPHFPSHLTDHSPTSPRSPVSPRPLNPHSPPGIASGYWPGQTPSSPRSPRQNLGWRDNRVPKRTTLQTLERERKLLGAKDSFAARPSSPLAPSSGLLPLSSSPSARSEWQSPPLSPLAPLDNASPPAFDLPNAASDPIASDPVRTHPASRRRSLSSHHMLLRPVSAQAQPQSPSGSSPRSPLSPSIVDPAPLPLSPPDSPRGAPPTASLVEGSGNGGHRNGPEAEPSGRTSPQRFPTSPMFATYPRRGSDAWSRDKPFSPGRAGLPSDHSDDVHPFETFRNGGRFGVSEAQSDPLGGGGSSGAVQPASPQLHEDDPPFGTSQTEARGPGDAQDEGVLKTSEGFGNGPEWGSGRFEGEGVWQAGPSAAISRDDSQEFSFQLAQVYEGPPLLGQIPVSEPVAYAKQGSGRLVPEGEEGGGLTAILSFSDLLPPDYPNGDKVEDGEERSVGEEGAGAMRRRAEGGSAARSSILGALFPRTKVVPSGGEEPGQGEGARVGQARDRRKGVCALCSRSSGVREKCLVCNKRYCQRCVANVNAMGSMPEGRKCTSCIGKTINEAFRDELGKTRMLRSMGFTQLEVANIMRAEVECKMNQIQPEQIIVNGRPLQADEMAQLVLCSNPPSHLKPGEYWYDQQAGFWGKLGGRPNQRIAAGLRFRGEMLANCSGGTTGVFLNNRELGRMELNILRVAGIEHTRGMRLWVDPDGSFSEEGQSRILGNLWEKSSVRLLSSNLSYPKLSQSAVPVTEESQFVTTVKAKLPPHLRGIVQKPAHKILLLGCVGSGRSTIIKQVKLLYGKGFTLEEIEAYKVVIMRMMWRALNTLLEMREIFSAEDLLEEEPDTSAARQNTSVARQDSSMGSVPEEGLPALPLRSNQDWVASSEEAATGDVRSGPEGDEEVNGLPGNGSDPWLRGHEGPQVGALSRHASSVSSARSTYSFERNKDELADWVMDIDADEDDLPVCDQANAAKLDELWRDPAVQATFERRAEVPELSPFASYFLDKVLELADPEYRPTVDDILHAEGLPQGQALTELEFAISPPERPPTTHSFILTPEPDFRVHLISVGYRETRKLLSMFDGVEAVVFCISLSEYDVDLEGENQMQQSRDAFQESLKQPSFRTKPIILLLNKFDAFANKIESGIPLSKCPWLADYQPLNEGQENRNQPQQAYSYVVYKFKEAYLKCVPEDPGMRNFFTCQLEALKDQGVETVFAYVKEVLQWRNVEGNGNKGFKLHHISYMADQELALCESNFEFPLTSEDAESDDRPGLLSLA